MYWCAWYEGGLCRDGVGGAKANPAYQCEDCSNAQALMEGVNQIGDEGKVGIDSCFPGPATEIHAIDEGINGVLVFPFVPDCSLFCRCLLCRMYVD